MEKNRLLIITGLLALIALVWAGVLYDHSTKGPKVDLITEGQPTIGNAKAPVHMVVFEEPKCPECRRFNISVFDELKKEYIDNDKIRFTVIPVSFIANSMPAATALLCVYHQNSAEPNNADLFMTYLNYIYHHQPTEKINWTTTDNLLDMAKKASPNIDLTALKHCIDSATYKDQITKNTQYGAKINEGRISTPGVYINGQKQHDISLEGLKNALNDALRHS